MPLDYRSNLWGCWETLVIMHKKISPAAGPCFVVLKQIGEIQKTTANPEDSAMNWILQDPEMCGSMEICGFMKILSLPWPLQPPKGGHLCKSWNSGTHWFSYLKTLCGFGMETGFLKCPNHGHLALDSTSRINLNSSSLCQWGKHKPEITPWMSKKLSVTTLQWYRFSGSKFRVFNKLAWPSYPS